MIQKTKRLTFLFTLLIAIDQITKYIFSKQTIDLGLIAITPITNTGMSFGLFNGNNLLFILITLAILTLLILFRKEFKETPVLHTLILAGATGNLIDRLIQGHVLDFIDLKFFPVFNIADTLIFLGVTGIIIYELNKMIKDNKNKKHPNKNKLKYQNKKIKNKKN